MLPEAGGPQRVAMITAHTCPMAQPGMRSAGGMNVYIKQVAQRLVAAGVCVDIFTRNHEAKGPAVVALGPKSRVVHFPAGPVDLSKGALFEHMHTFLEELDAFYRAEGVGYDLVHSHYWLSGWVGDAVARTWSVPHVVTFHTLAAVKQWATPLEETPPERKETEALVSSRADRVLAFTESERLELVDWYNVPATRIHLAPGGVDSELFQPHEGQATARRRLGLDPHEKVVLYVGRLEDFKGIRVLLHAVAQTRTEGLRLVVVGGGSDQDPEVAQLQRLTLELGLKERVRWRSARPQAELPDYYEAADVCVVPSYHESFGLVALEAMACGTPVIAAKVGGLQSLVLNGLTGRLVDGHAPEAFARCLEELLGNPEVLQRLGDAARRWARRFPWSHAAQTVFAAYEAALASDRERVPVAPCLG